MFLNATGGMKMQFKCKDNLKGCFKKNHLLELPSFELEISFKPMELLIMSPKSILEDTYIDKSYKVTSSVWARTDIILRTNSDKMKE